MKAYVPKFLIRAASHARIFLIQSAARAKIRDLHKGRPSGRSILEIYQYLQTLPGVTVGPLCPMHGDRKAGMTPAKVRLTVAGVARDITFP